MLRNSISAHSSDKLNSASPVNEAVEQLLSTAVLGYKHQVAWCDISFMQSHDPFVMKGLEDVVLLQHCLLTVSLIWNDLGHEEVSCGVLSALTDHTKTAPVRKRHAMNSAGKHKLTLDLIVMIFLCTFVSLNTQYY